MEKKIKFDANMRAGAKPDHHPIAWIPVPDDLYGQILLHPVNDQWESVKRFHVTLSPVEDPERSRRVEEPDYDSKLGVQSKWTPDKCQDEDVITKGQLRRRFEELTPVRHVFWSKEDILNLLRQEVPLSIGDHQWLYAKDEIKAKHTPQDNQTGKKKEKK